MGAASIALNGKVHTMENRECKQTSTSSFSGEAALSGNTGSFMLSEPAKRAARIPVMAPHCHDHGGGGWGERPGAATVARSNHFGSAWRKFRASDWQATAVTAAWFACVLLAGAAGVALAQAPAVIYEHRVAVATTSLDRELDVEQSLARNVNALASRGFEVGAIAGGSGPLLDRLLDRRPYVPGQVDHGGHVFVIMHRPAGQPAPVREYRFLHARGPVGVEQIVAAYGRDGFRLTVTAWEGDYFHGAFERGSGSEPVEYRVFRTARRRGWDQQMLDDTEVKQRLRRVIPMTLDSAIVELGPPAGPPAEFVWESDAPHQRSRLEPKLNARAAAGFRVQIARMRGNVLDVAMLKPAGASGPAPALDLDDGPWGGPCSRGTIAGAAIWSDGDVYCVAEDPKGPVMNRGFDMVVAPQADVGGQLFFGGVDCGIRARLRTSRVAAARVARAFQLEREINRRVEPGYRVTRAFAGVREDGDQRLVFFTSLLPAPAVSGKPAAPVPAARLAAELDGLGQQLLAQREREINDALAAGLRELNVDVWTEINDVPANRHVLLLGCVRTRQERERAETVLRGLLIRTPYTDYRIRNEIIVELLR
jgi:hypothetical protein